MHSGAGIVVGAAGFPGLIGGLLLLLLVGNPPSLGLALPDLPQVDPDGAAGERVGLGEAPVLLVGGPEAADEGVEAPPGLAEGARARRGGLGLPVEHAALQMHLGLAELVQIPQELQHVVAVALRQRHRWPLVLQVLPERVPVPPLLRLVPARRRRSSRGRIAPGSFRVSAFASLAGHYCGINWEFPLGMV